MEIGSFHRNNIILNDCWMWLGGSDKHPLALGDEYIATISENDICVTSIYLSFLFCCSLLQKVFVSIDKRFVRQQDLYLDHCLRRALSKNDNRNRFNISIKIIFEDFLADKS